MLRFLYAFFFGCFHSRTTFPMTLTNRSPVDGQIRRRTYVACLKCGEELAYNWQKMKVEWPATSTPLRAQPLVSIATGRRGFYSKYFTAGKRKLTRADAERQGWVVFQAGRTFGAGAPTVAGEQSITRLLAK